jgi:hypothetical protein
MTASNTVAADSQDVGKNSCLPRNHDCWGAGGYGQQLGFAHRGPAGCEHMLGEARSFRGPGPETKDAEVF